VYCGAILVLPALENALIFRPVRAEEDWGAAPAGAQDVFLPTAGHGRIHAWWCPRQRTRQAVLYCHGNAGNLSHRAGAVARWQQELDVSVLIFDYPGYGRSDGAPSEVGCYAAGEAAWRWLTDGGRAAPEDVILYGGSLGGAVAVDLASRYPHRCLVLVSAFTSMPDMAQKLYPWLPGRWLMRSRFDNLAKIARSRGPVFIAHGDCDRLVPFEQGQRLFAAAGEPKYFFPLAGCDHNDTVNPEFFSSLRRFLEST
jgi:fermentation-respiration switch protein FrsA (DUF1100 family)